MWWRKKGTDETVQFVHRFEDRYVARYISVLVDVHCVVLRVQTEYGALVGRDDKVVDYEQSLSSWPS